MKCYNCEADNDAAVDLTGSRKAPEPGDFLICMYCAMLSVYTGDGLELRQPTIQEVMKASEMPEVRDVVRILYEMGVWK